MIKKVPAVIKYTVLVLILCVFIFGIYAANVLYIKKLGINLKPSEEIKPYNVHFFLQNDPRWKDNNLGNSRYKIGSHGCLLSVIAASGNYLGYSSNPEELNDLFREKGVYTDYGDIIWFKINEAIPDINYKYKRIFSSNTILSDLKNGYLPIVMVKYNKTGIYHWVLIVGSTKDDFLIIDPLNQNKEVTTLQTHGKVYAYRVLINNY